MRAPDEDRVVEDDPVWDLVDRAAPRAAGALFTRNVMREVRLASERSLPWWKQLITPKPILAGSLAAVTVAILITVDSDEPGQTAVTEPAPAPMAELQAPQLDTLLEEEMLSQAAEDPAAFSDEALVTLLNQ